ncbi:MAG: translesion DNA synthesis-associated protein ImuA [Gammaproteobacteria bacterium]|nr:translesion DNA synthesis-associated protein ImuA [Gammaproteobacteria bacterium]
MNHHERQTLEQALQPNLSEQPSITDKASPGNADKTSPDKAFAGKIWAGKVWRARDLSSSGHQQVLDTGHRLLNDQLQQGGWPLNTITELGLSQAGIGELRLLTPALSELMRRQHSQQSVLCIAPPLLPYAPALLREGLDIDQFIVVQTHSIQDTLWATEQALLAGCCAAVLSWTGQYNLSPRELRRLQLAAEQSHTWQVLFRHSDCLKQTSVSGLRLHLKSDSYNKLDISILKQPQGWGGQHCSLSLQPHYENWQRLPASLLPQQNQAQAPLIPQQLNSISNSDQCQASVTLLSAVSALQSVH